MFTRARPSPGVLLSLTLFASATLLIFLTSTSYSLPSRLTVFRPSTNTSADVRESPSTCTSPDLCNPLLYPGYINRTPKSFIPLSNECPPALDVPALLQSLVSALRNKIFYFYGDSVARMLLSDFCTYIQGDYQGVPDPPGYRTAADLQAIHVCRHEALNFSAVNVYHYGVQEYNGSSKVDVHFLSNHPSVPFGGYDKNATNYRAEVRISIPQPTLTSSFGRADMVFMLTGMWDLPSLLRRVVGDFMERNIPQTEEPPEDWIPTYQDRLRIYISMVRSLHAGNMKKAFWIPLHDARGKPGDLDPKNLVGLQGTPKSWWEKTKFGALTEVRVRALRNAQLEVARELKLDILPYHLWLKEAPKDMRMRDGIHPSQWANEFFALAAVLEARKMDAGC